MSHSLRWLTRCVAIALVAFALQAPATADDAPMLLVRTTTAELFAQVRADRDALRADPSGLHAMLERLLLPHVDLERTSRLVLGKHWRRASPPQRDDFMHQFRELLLRTYATALVEFADVSVDYLDTRYSEDGDGAIVRTRVNLSDGRPPVGIDYRLGNGDGGWKVFDVSVGGVSLVTTYRASFSEEVGRVGLEGLLRTLRERMGSGSGA